MNRRQAKREACFRAASVVENALSGGWPAEQYPDEADLERVVEALNELMDELLRRGGRER